MADDKNQNQQGNTTSSQNQDQLTQSVLNEAEQALQDDPLKEAVEKKKREQ